MGAPAAVGGSIRPGGYQDEVEIVNTMHVPLVVLEGEHEQLVSLDLLETSLYADAVARPGTDCSRCRPRSPLENSEAFNALLAAFVEECERRRS